MLILFAVIFSQLAPMYDKKSMDESKKGFMKHFYLFDNENYQFSAKVLDTHLNTGGIAHGGYFCSSHDSLSN